MDNIGFHLSTCNTCQKILAQINTDKLTLQDIKTEKMTPAQVDRMIELAGSAEAIFSRRSMKYRSIGLADKELSESDYRRLIMDEYTFLKRPVFIVNGEIFIGNAKKTVEALQAALQ